MDCDVNSENDFHVLTKKDISLWRKDFDRVRQYILKSSDVRSKNYSQQRMNIDSLDEITILYHNREVVAFSSLYHAPFYPRGVARVLNRTWKAPSFRWQKPAYHIISQLMLRTQLDVAYKNNYDFVFLSTEGLRNRWWERWVAGANQDFPGWVIHPEMVKVCTGPYRSCWQSVVYKPLKDFSTEFPMESISQQKWRQCVGEV